MKYDVDFGFMMLYSLLFAFAAFGGAYLIRTWLFRNRIISGWVAWTYAISIFLVGTALLSMVWVTERRITAADTGIALRSDFQLRMATPAIAAFAVFSLLAAKK